MNESEEECCSLCLGTGIGQHGDPDTSICSMCKGKGHMGKVEERDPDQAYDEMRDRQLEREWDDNVVPIGKRNKG